MAESHVDKSISNSKHLNPAAGGDTSELEAKLDRVINLLKSKFPGSVQRPLMVSNNYCFYLRASGADGGNTPVVPGLFLASGERASDLIGISYDRPACKRPSIETLDIKGLFLYDI